MFGTEMLLAFISRLLGCIKTFYFFGTLPHSQNLENLGKNKNLNKPMLFQGEPRIDKQTCHEVRTSNGKPLAE